MILSAQTAQSLAPWLRARVRESTSLTVKGKLKDIGIFELVWQESEDELTQIRTRVKLAPARIRLRMAGANSSSATTDAASRSAAKRRTTS